MNYKSTAKMIFFALAVSLFIIGCTPAPTEESKNTEAAAAQNSGVVNLYTDRHYDSDDALYAAFTAETGITVNVVKGKSDELIERLKTEGADTEADVFITADAGRLHRAKVADLLEAINSDTLLNNIPENLRDPENFWFGLTKRARVVVYAKDRVSPEELGSYWDLIDEKWLGRILVRPGDNIYNLSLMASFIELQGEEKATEWAQGIVKNLARPPKGGDRDQAKAVIAGEGDIAIMNTYYLGQMLNSSDPEEVKVAEQLGVFFPDQDQNGTHINVSGAGVTKHGKNRENAILLLEYLIGETAQEAYAQGNYEYPVNPKVEAADLLKSWGTFKEQPINLSKLGEFGEKALQIITEVGWK